MSEKITKICDPLYGYIYLDQKEKNLINQPIFQRLRQIRQLGFSEQAFPSGTANRFSHSLGVCHLAGVVFDSLFEKNKSISLSRTKKDMFRKTVRMAGLLHDIGHGPLSHSSEVLMPSLKDLGLEKFIKTEKRKLACHEDFSLKFIMEDKSLSQALQEIGVEPYAVAQLLYKDFYGGEDFFKIGDLNFLPVLRQIISSDFDVDRMDYMHRDSLHCGVKYGLIDFMWLISHFDFHIEESDVYLSIGRGGLYTVESFILGRQHMRLIVYFHHKSVIYDQMFKKYSEESSWRLPSSISDYLYWTDDKLFAKLKSDNNVWAKRITEHKPYLRLYENVFFAEWPHKNFMIKIDKQKNNSLNIESLKNLLKEERIDFIDIDSQKHSPPGRSSSFKKYNIYLKNESEAQPLYKTPSFLSFPIRTIQRIYVPPESFSQAQSLLKKL